MIAAVAMVVATASPAAAHHGWDGFHVDELVYFSGTVSSEGSWGEPHSYFDVTMDSDLPAHTPELEIPEELQDPEDSVRVNAALAYAGPHDELEVIIAPPAWSGRWGLGRALEVGERFQGVGYINRTDDGLFRPVVFWYGDDNVPVNQVLGNTLPVRAPLPGEAPLDEDLGAAVSAAPDPIEDADDDHADDDHADDDHADEEHDSEAAAPETASDSTWIVWTVFGVVVVVAIGGGVFYVRRSARKGGAEDA
ncbi:MAG: hypothetical protein R2722_17255 [Tessaracoccus sp.]